MIWRVAFFAAVALMFAVLGNNGHQVQQQEPQPSADVQDIVHQEQAEIAEKDIEIHGLEMELQSERTLASRSIGLIQYEPQNWSEGWDATFYDGDKGINGTGTGITKSGMRASKDWTVAADTSRLPLGTIIEVQYRNWLSEPLQVQDIGGAIKGKRLDIYVPNYAEDMKLGRERVRIRVMEAVK